MAVWALDDAGIPRGVIDHSIAQLREVHDGVYASGHGPLSDWQRWKAASITTRDSLLSGWSGSCLVDIRDADKDRFPTTITRPGDGGIVRIPPRPGRIGSLVAHRSLRRITEDAIVVDGIATLGHARTVLDLLPNYGEEKGGRLVREALRRTHLEGVDLLAAVGLNPGVRAVARLRTYTELYGDLPGGGRTRSDAEILALALLKAAGIRLPAVNQWIGGEEADFVYYDERLIVEIDGPQYHQFAVEDARKQKIWESHGFVVRRLPSDDVYRRPHQLFEATTKPLARDELARAGRRV